MGRTSVEQVGKPKAQMGVACSVSQVVQGGAWLPDQGFRLLVPQCGHPSGLSGDLLFCNCKSHGPTTSPSNSSISAWELPC